MTAFTLSLQANGASWAHERLRLGQANVGTWVLLSLAILAAQPALPDGLPDVVAWALIVATHVLVQAPFDVLGGYLLPARHGRSGRDLAGWLIDYEPTLSYPEDPSGRRSDGIVWDGRHELLVLPAEGDPIEVPRQWQRPVPDYVWPLSAPLVNVPVVAIDAARPWREVCPHLRPWQARAGRPLDPPPHLAERKPPAPIPDDSWPPPPPPPPPPPHVDAHPCVPLAVALGPAHPSAPEAPEYPVLKRTLGSVCTGEGREGVLFEAVITRDGVTASAAGNRLANVDELNRRLRAAQHKDVRVSAIAPDTPWARVLGGIDRIRSAGAGPVWLPLDCGT